MLNPSHLLPFLRYQKAATQRRMFSMYFLFVGGLMEDERENNALTKSVSKKIDRPSLTRILLCFLFILRKVRKGEGER